MSKTIINSDSVPSPIGPYSQAVCFGNIIYTSGQIALDADSGMLVNSNIDEETKKVMHNLENLLREAGSGFSKVLKTSIFLKNMDDFAAVNAIYASYFEDNFPARETVQVSRLPKDANVEISMIAYRE
ncbi:MAG: RidA family protein [Bacteroidota bacterium]|jgi:2-iminobutanoate/2-iminopropanoate deaminase